MIECNTLRYNDISLTKHMKKRNWNVCCSHHQDLSYKIITIIFMAHVEIIGIDCLFHIKKFD